MTDGYCGITLLIALTCTAAGCSQGDVPDLAPVSGIVTLDGQPLADKEIIFAPTKGRPSSGKTDANGAYELSYTVDVKGAIIGQHAVTITTPPPSDGNFSGFKETVPARYNARSELKAEVTAGRNNLNFELQAK